MKWILCLLLFVALLVLAGAAYAYRIAFYMSRKDREKKGVIEGPYEVHRAEIIRTIELIKNRPCEIVTIRSHDGLTLSGRYYHTADGAPLAIGCHGYRSSAFTDFAWGSEMILDMGHNLLLVDERAHGLSQGKTISFGILERWDVLEWVDYALARFGEETQILLYGVSMGAATVLMTADLELPKNVKGIIADCPYSVPLDIILHVGEYANPLPTWLMRPFVLLGARIYGRFDLQKTDAVRAVEKTNVPILILHGEADGFVPCTMSEGPQKANPQLVQRHTFPGADHAISCMVQPERYRSIVTKFIQSLL